MNATYNMYRSKAETHGIRLRTICRVHFLVSVRIPRLLSLPFLKKKQMLGTRLYKPLKTFHIPFVNSSIIHQKETKKITTVTVVWICVSNYHKILPTCLEFLQELSII